MDAVKYIEEKERMCGTFGNCDGCPIRKSCDPNAEDAKDVVAAVEKWSKEHPVMTNGRKLSDMLGRNKRNFTRRNEGKPYVEIWIDAEWWDAEYKEESND